MDKNTGLDKSDNLDKLDKLSDKQAYYILRFKTQGYDNCIQKIHERNTR